MGAYRPGENNLFAAIMAGKLFLSFGNFFRNPRHSAPQPLSAETGVWGQRKVLNL